MPSWQSKYVRALGWDIATAADPGSGTDSNVTLEILRDGQVVIALNVEPGETERLDRGNSVFHYHYVVGTHFEPGDIVSWVGGLGYPNGIEFSDDIGGHLRCRLRIHGDDKWVKDNIGAYVKYTSPQHVAGTIDSQIWADDISWTFIGNFSQDVAMSTDAGEGVSTWTLAY